MMSQNLVSLPPLSHYVTLRRLTPLPPLTCDVIYGWPLKVENHVGRYWINWIKPSKILTRFQYNQHGVAGTIVPMLVSDQAANQLPKLTENPVRRCDAETELLSCMQWLRVRSSTIRAGANPATLGVLLPTGL